MIFGADYLQVMQVSKYKICENRRSESNFSPPFHISCPIFSKTRYKRSEYYSVQYLWV